MHIIHVIVTLSFVRPEGEDYIAIIILILIIIRRYYNMYFHVSRIAARYVLRIGKSVVHARLIDALQLGN